MKSTNNHRKQTGSIKFLVFGWTAILLVAYGRLILDPTLHTACPENDTWNLPIRWSVLSALNQGHLPLWNPLSAFGIPWLATWQTETFYPGTFLFRWFGLSAWNFSGLLHLLIFSIGIFCFLGNLGVNGFWAFLSAVIGLLNGCAYNHLGSNSSMDTMAWIPWVFWATHHILERRWWAGWSLSLFLTLQVFAGYPQIILYTMVGAFAYAVFQGRWSSLRLLVLPFALGLALSTCQWLPSAEYFFLQCVRLPSVQDNPHFFLPVENLKTFWNFNALWNNGTPDYVLSPTFFYFNFFSGLIPLAVLAGGLIRFNKISSTSRFFLNGFLILFLWSLGTFWKPLEVLHLPLPGFLEPAKCWVLINVFLLASFGLILKDLFPKPGNWKWAVLALGLLNLLVPVWNHPLERNLLPGNLDLETKALNLKNQLSTGRLLILPNEKEHAALYTPFPDPVKRPVFKRFTPNSNLFANIPVPTFYGSTWPTWGSLDAALYFQTGFPYDSGNLLDLLGVDLLYLPENQLPSKFKKIQTDGSWTLWRNPTSMGSDFFFQGDPTPASRKESFEAFAKGADPRQTLFLDPATPKLSTNRLCDYDSPSSNRIFRPAGKKGYWVVGQNALPGWRAWADGAPTEVAMADGIFLGVKVPPNCQWVKLSYEPTSFRFGLFVSLLSWGCLIGFFGFRKLLAPRV